MSYRYDDLFFDYLEQTARISAHHILPVLSEIPIRSVLDVGCGRGAWIGEWKNNGATSVLGVDGDYVDVKNLAVPQADFKALDVSKPFDLGRQFDLVECLEVAEHVPTQTSATIIENLIRHAPLVYFSAATPGQGGEFHVNEQPLSFWRELFRGHDYHAFDFIRPRIAGNEVVASWYRYNSILYVRANHIASLPPSVARTRIADGDEIPEVAPISWRLRRAVLRHLPVDTVTQLAVLKHRLAVALFGQR